MLYTHVFDVWMFEFLKKRQVWPFPKSPRVCFTREAPLAFRQYVGCVENICINGVTLLIFTYI